MRISAFGSYGKMTVVIPRNRRAAMSGFIDFAEVKTRCSIEQAVARTAMHRRR